MCACECADEGSGGSECQGVDRRLCACFMRWIRRRAARGDGDQHALDAAPVSPRQDRTDRCRDLRRGMVANVQRQLGLERAARQQGPRLRSRGAAGSVLALIFTLQLEVKSSGDECSDAFARCRLVAPSSSAAAGQTRHYDGAARGCVRSRPAPGLRGRRFGCALGTLVRAHVCGSLIVADRHAARVSVHYDAAPGAGGIGLSRQPSAARRGNRGPARDVVRDAGRSVPVESETRLPDLRTLSEPRRTVRAGSSRPGARQR